MQAFLRDDLTVFCREAPGEFNDHQREVFCVFSGTGVARLREYLNGGGTAMETGIVDSDEEGGPAPPTHRQLPQPHPNQMQWQQGAVGQDDGMEDEDMEDDGEATPVELQEEPQHPIVNVHVHSTPGPSNSQMIPSPNASPYTGFARSASTDAVVSTGSRDESGGGALWAVGPSYAQQSSSRPAGGSGHVTRTASGEAQHVTGMMGAAMLDDVDDETFGEESEIFGQASAAGH